MGQHQICAFGKYENGLPLLCRDDAACKDWQEVSTKSAQTDDVKGVVRSLGSLDILSNGNGRRYLHKKGGRRRKEQREYTRRIILPARFGYFCALFGLKTPKRTGMTSLGFPGLSSQPVAGFFGPFRPENPETDWDDEPGLPTYPSNR